MVRESLWLLLLLVAAPGMEQVNTLNSEGIVTVFRENYTAHAPLNISYKDQWPKRLHMKLLLDGKPLVDMRGERFASFRLPAGRHVIEFEKLAGESAQFELHAGERVFVRPGVVLNLLRQQSMAVVVPCTEAVEIGKDAKPMEAKWVLSASSIAETRFPAGCETN